MSENKFKRFLSASKSESILAVVEGLPVDANGFFLTEPQLSAIDAELDSNAVAIANHASELQALGGQLAASAESLTAAQAELATANASIAEKDVEIANLQAKVKTLEESAPPPAQTQKEKDETGGGKTAWVNPMNALADSLLGAPKKAEEKK